MNIKQIILFIIVFSTNTYSSDLETKMQGEWEMIYRNRYGVVDTIPYSMKVIGNKFYLNKTIGEVEILPDNCINIKNQEIVMMGKYILSDDIQIVYFSQKDNVRPKTLYDKNIRINIWKRKDK